MGEDAQPRGLPSDRDLDKVRRRFQALNQRRLGLVLGELRPQQQDFLTLLPLLFHINSPLLPGFLSPETPAGVAGFHPEQRQLDTARKLSRGFQYQSRALREYPIHALYLMGSVGSIGHSRGSDLDIWLCHQPGLVPAALEALTAKARRLEQWAAELGVEAHFFLMDAEEFRHGKRPTLSGESSGSTQHLLLLEEFYRSSVLVAGRFPLWWLVPPDQEARYGACAAELQRAGLVDASECLDFGGLAEIPAEEFYGAALWQLYKGVYSPYKAVLKILLSEAYVRGYPEVDWLAQQIKRGVHAGETDLERFDPYVLLYRHLEAYLQEREQPERLELARRCLYFKVGEALSRPQGTPNWRARRLAALTREWGWGQDQLRDLDARPHWKVHRVTKERSQLVREMTRSYKLLTEFAASHGDSMRVDPQELDLLGRKLYTALEQRPGKIERVNPGISKDLTETELALHWQPNPDGAPVWTLYRGPLDPAGRSTSDPIKVSTSLTELLAWCQINGLVTPRTRYVLTPPEAPVHNRELTALLQVLRQSLPDVQGLETPLEQLARPPFPLRLLILVNTGTDPLADLSREGMRLLSDRSNPLSFGSARRCLLQELELLILTSWGELMVHRHQGPEGLMDALSFYLDLSRSRPEDAPPTDLRVEGFNTPETRLLCRRVAEVFSSARAHFAQVPGGRYVLELGTQYFILEAGQRGFHWSGFGNEESLVEGLGEARGSYAPPTCDPQSLAHSPLAAVFRACRPGEQQLFFQTLRGLTRVHVLDESGSLFRQDLPGEEPRFVLMQLLRFLESLARLRRQSGMSEEGATLITGPRVYRLDPTRAGGWEAVLIRLPRAWAEDDFLELRLLAEGQGQEARLLGLVCGDRSYSALTLGPRLYPLAVQHILAHRRGAGDYPIYLTAVELAQTRYGVPPSGVEILALKRRVELRLNDVLQSLSARPDPAPEMEGART